MQDAAKKRTDKRNDKEQEWLKK